MNPAFLALLLGALLTGLNPLLVRLADIDPAAIGFWRVLLMLPLFLLWPKPDRAEEQMPGWRDRTLLLVAGAAYGADLVVWYWSIELTSIANAQLFAFTYPLMVALVAAFFLGQPLSRRGWTAILLGVAGSALVVAGREGGFAFEAGPRMIGDGLGFAAAACYTVTLSIQGSLRGRIGTRRVLLDSTLGALFLLAPATLFARGAVLPPDPGEWLLMAALGLVTFASQLLIVYALGRLPVVLAAISGTLSVVVAAGGAWLFLAERLGPIELAGIAVVLGAILIAERKAAAKAPAAAPKAPAAASRRVPPPAAQLAPALAPDCRSASRRP